MVVLTLGLAAGIEEVGRWLMGGRRSSAPGDGSSALHGEVSVGWQRFAEYQNMHTMVNWIGCGELAETDYLSWAFGQTACQLRIPAGLFSTSLTTVRSAIRVGGSDGRAVAVSRPNS